MVYKCLSEGRQPSENEVVGDEDVVGCVGDALIGRTNSEIHKDCYRLFICVWQGPLGVGNRVPLPDCVTSGVRHEFPSETGMYMGYYNVK